MVITVDQGRSNFGCAFFRASTNFLVGDECTILFWTDPCGCVLHHGAGPRARGDTVPAQRRGRTTLAAGIQGNAWMESITGPLTVPVLIQHVEIRVQETVSVLH
jgi:hypothetical protein